MSHGSWSVLEKEEILLEKQLVEEAIHNFNQCRGRPSPTVASQSPPTMALPAAYPEEEYDQAGEAYL